MNLLIKDFYIENKRLKSKNITASDFYDKYAAMVYGHIYDQVGSEKLANQIHIEVFTDVFSKPNDFSSTLLTSFCLLKNHSSIKTKRVLKAIEMFDSCKIC